MAELKSTNSHTYISSQTDTYIAILDAKHAQTINDFYTLTATALLFPAYFGNNMDAFEEMLSDLEWIPQAHVLLIINRSQYLLQNENDENKASIRDILSSDDANKIEVIFN